MKKIILFLLLFLSGYTIFSQQKVRIHNSGNDFVIEVDSMTFEVSDSDYVVDKSGILTDIESLQLSNKKLLKRVDSVQTIFDDFLSEIEVLENQLVPLMFEFDSLLVLDSYYKHLYDSLLLVKIDESIDSTNSSYRYFTIIDSLNQVVEFLDNRYLMISQLTNDLYSKTDFLIEDTLLLFQRIIEIKNDLSGSNVLEIQSSIDSLRNVLSLLRVDSILLENKIDSFEILNNKICLDTVFYRSVIDSLNLVCKPLVQDTLLLYSVYEPILSLCDKLKNDTLIYHSKYRDLLFLRDKLVGDTIRLYNLYLELKSGNSLLKTNLSKLNSDVVSLTKEKTQLISDTLYLFNTKKRLKDNLSKTGVPFYDYVDLGLSDGTLWATCNVGANSPEEIGYYVSWCEGNLLRTNTGYYDNNTHIKSSYSWSTYAYCNGSYSSINQYTDAGATGVPYAGLSTVWTYYYGGKWGDPSPEQFVVLMNECYWVYTDNYKGTGVAGFIVYAAQGPDEAGVVVYDESMAFEEYDIVYSNHIFLPLTGRYGGSSLTNKTHGLYWTNKVSYTEGKNYNAQFFDFSLDGIGCSETYRCYGLPVRPVVSKSN